MESVYREDVERAVAGEKEAFVRLMLAMEPQLFRVSRSILKTDSECFDAVQEAVLHAYRSIQSLREPRFFKTWMIRILMNVCYRNVREKKKVILLSEADRQQERDQRIEEQVELQEALLTLEEDLHLVIQLHYFEGFSVREIAEMLQIAEGTIKSRLVKARATLAKWYRADGEERRHLSYEG